eukprot:scaffold81834_cov32-Attheya_sp.AAC.1
MMPGIEPGTTGASPEDSPTSLPADTPTSSQVKTPSFPCISHSDAYRGTSTVLVHLKFSTFQDHK